MIYYSCLCLQIALSKQCLFGFAPNLSYLLTWDIINKEGSHLCLSQQNYKVSYCLKNINTSLEFNYQTNISKTFSIFYNRLKQMPGKKWCEFCRINLPFDKKAIQEHEATRRHIHNQQKSIKFARIKIQQQQKIKREIQKANSFISTANIPKAKKGSQLQKQVAQYRNEIVSSGKMAIQRLIAEKTKGVYGAPIQYPQKQDLVLAENYQDQKPNQQGQDNDDSKFEMWRIDICEQTGKACFINRISQAKLYEPPKGYILSQQQKQQWQQTKRICQDVSEGNNENVGQIGQWEIIQDQEDYFQKNRVNDSADLKVDSQVVVKKQNQGDLAKYEDEIKAQNNNQIVQKSWIDEIHQRVQRNQMTESEVIGAVLTNTLQQCRTVKQKNEALKKLVRNDFEIRATLLEHDQMLKIEEKSQKKGIGIKPRKKVKLCPIVQQRDLV